jgi:probable F420-dependent oxidoreductase
MQLTKYGVWIGRTIAEPEYGAAAALAERLGFGTLWLGGSPRLPVLRGLLQGSSDKLTIATGIVNVWQYEPDELAQEFQALDADFPGRVLLGIGIGHPEATSEYKTPLAKMTEFFDGLSAAQPPVPRERLVAAALGPKMLDLSFERALGTHPYFVPPEHTSFARERLGADALIAPELAVSISGLDAAAQREAAREYATMYCGLQNYTKNLERFGYTQEDFADGGSDRLLDAIVPQGSAEQVAAAVHAHLDAGADHVCVQTVGVQGVPTAEWTALAAELIG